MNYPALSNSSPLLSTKQSDSLFRGLLIIIGLLVYYPVYFLQFQASWDDQWVVINHYTENGWNATNIWAILTEYYNGQYAPLNQLYYTALYSIFGYHSNIFHTAGLIIHLLNSLLVYCFIDKLLYVWRRTDQSANRKIAFFTALLFVLHPITVESVAWLSASKVLIYALFYLLSLIAYLNYLLNNKPLYLLISGVCFVLSFASKEQAVTLPVCLLLLDYIAARKFNNKVIWLEKLPFSY